jgi:hypothetical protein
MRFSGITFFADKKNGPKVHVNYSNDIEFPVSINITQGPSWNNPITIFFRSEYDYITFKNSVIQSHEAILRTKAKNAKKGLDK